MVSGTLADVQIVNIVNQIGTHMKHMKVLTLWSELCEFKSNMQLIKVYRATGTEHITKINTKKKTPFKHGKH